ncbi:MAG: sodium:proton antiporter [Alphaproteobacteria bacterium]|nr:sodium:proton antiporter [Alphaproteobacteria bacterium]
MDIVAHTRRAKSRVARLFLPLSFGLLFITSPAFAAEALHGRDFSIVWALPFIGMLLSIALGPLLAPHFWEHHQGKIATLWGLLLVVPLVMSAGVASTSIAFIHTMGLDYVPFILLLMALFVPAGGIVIRGNIHGSPLTNSFLLVIGMVLASFIGTTGASMVMIRPIMRANDNRRHNVHVVIFFIFLVSNIGGSLTPLGDPPLFLGFLKGVDFFWTTTHIFPETLFVGGVVLALFYALDLYFYRKEGVTRDPTPDSPISVSGFINMILIGIVIAAVLMSAIWKPGTFFTLMGIAFEGQDLLRNLLMILVVIASLLLTRVDNRAENGFSWGPMTEVAKLFAGIFVTMIPVLAMLKAGTEGAFAPLVSLVTNLDGTPNPAVYFWLTGGLSSFLDNAPTYLVFFELAGGNAQHLMMEGALTLAAISAGAVFMGANTYIGNAPNFMVYAIARSSGVKMPGFFGYMLWSGAVLLPTFVLTSLIFFR